MPNENLPSLLGVGIRSKLCFVGSTDLTHYGPNYGFTSRGQGADAVQWVREVNDRGFLDQLLARNPEGTIDHAAEHRSACCSGAVAATIAARDAFGQGPEPRLVDHYLSHDIQPSSSFVGYAGVVL